MKIKELVALFICSLAIMYVPDSHANQEEYQAWFDKMEFDKGWSNQSNEKGQVLGYSHVVFDENRDFYKVNSDMVITHRGDVPNEACRFFKFAEHTLTVNGKMVMFDVSCKTILAGGGYRKDIVYTPKTFEGVEYMKSEFYHKNTVKIEDAIFSAKGYQASLKGVDKGI